MTSRNLCTFMGVLLLGPAIASADGCLRVSADLAQVSIAPRPLARSFVRLPSIEFAFNVKAECQEDWTAGSVSLSIADTRASFSAGQIDTAAQREVKVVVPQTQIAPLALADFCNDGTATSNGRSDVDQMVVRDVLSLQASLLCASDNGKKMTYISRPLDILLTCERSDAEIPADSAIDP